MDKKRIDNAIDIINYAIKNNTSIKKSCVDCGFGDTYVKNVKSLMIKEYGKGWVNGEDYKRFFNLYNQYEKSRTINSVATTKEKEEPKINPVNKISQQEKNNVLNIDYTANSSYPKGHIKTLSELLEKCQVDKDLWDVKDYTVNKWDVTSFKQVNPKTIENFQVKARLEKKVHVVDRLEVQKIFVDNITNYTPPKFNTNFSQVNKTDNLLEVCLFDAHFNKYVWHEETDDRYDVDIAEQRFLSAIKTFVDRAKGFGFDRILFPVGNDFFNSDVMGNMTTGGTPQDNQLLWHEAFRRGVKLIKDAIYLLKENNVPVDVMVIAGNHDFANSFYLGEYLSAWFNNDEIVTINNSPNPRKYYKYGEVLLGFTHGSEEKRDSLPLLMANERKELWANSKFREWHLGHFHRKRNYKYTVLDKTLEVDEEDGMIVRYLSSLAGTDSWHNKKGYVTNQKAGDGFIWSSSNGLLAHININA